MHQIEAVLCFLFSQWSDYHWGFPPPALQGHRLRSHGYRCWSPQQRPVLSSWWLPHCLHWTVSSFFTHLSVSLLYSCIHSWVYILLQFTLLSASYLHCINKHTIRLICPFSIRDKLGKLWSGDLFNFLYLIMFCLNWTFCTPPLMLHPSTALLSFIDIWRSLGSPSLTDLLWLMTSEWGVVANLGSNQCIKQQWDKDMENLSW